ncbi:pkinase-domain-containing protein [Ceraceosorus bombacis]|uniref:Pkinase-domain-containing protein n=1 Tax=Ceraceosorus bombacis TaxID=401625 RepID=A0A0P1BKZ7_9BASI|nr:pkinase-domain-containing protein [Ceraceosorus bombacis]
MAPFYGYYGAPPPRPSAYRGRYGLHPPPPRSRPRSPDAVAAARRERAAAPVPSRSGHDADVSTVSEYQSGRGSGSSSRRRDYSASTYRPSPAASTSNADRARAADWKGKARLQDDDDDAASRDGYTSKANATISRGRRLERNRSCDDRNSVHSRVHAEKRSVHTSKPSGADAGAKETAQASSNNHLKSLGSRNADGSYEGVPTGPRANRQALAVFNKPAPLPDASKSNADWSTVDRRLPKSSRADSFGLSRERDRSRDRTRYATREEDRRPDRERERAREGVSNKQDDDGRNCSYHRSDERLRGARSRSRSPNRSRQHGTTRQKDERDQRERHSRSRSPRRPPASQKELDPRARNGRPTSSAAGIENLDKFRNASQDATSKGKGPNGSALDVFSRPSRAPPPAPRANSIGALSYGSGSPRRSHSPEISQVGNGRVEPGNGPLPGATSSELAMEGMPKAPPAAHRERIKSSSTESGAISETPSSLAHKQLLPARSPAISSSSSEARLLARKSLSPEARHAVLRSSDDAGDAQYPPRRGGWTVISRGKPTSAPLESVQVSEAGEGERMIDVSGRAPTTAVESGQKEEPQSPGPKAFTPSPEPDMSSLAAQPTRGFPDETYTRINQVGEGTYGQVFKARAERSGALVALKKIRMEAEKDGFPVTAMREIKLLQHLRHPNVVRLHEMMVSKGSIYLVFEYMEHDLNGVLQHPSIEFSAAHLKSLSRQFLRGLEYLHKKSVLHRDIKGSNILLSNHGILKLADFGLARFYAKRRADDYTNRVVTVWYKPPELLFGATRYGPEIDMWGAGCIFLELFTRRPVLPGNSEIHQVQVIYDTFGALVPASEWPEVEALPWYDFVKPVTSLDQHGSEPLPSQVEEPTSSHGAAQDASLNAGVGLQAREKRFRKMFSKWLSPAALSVAWALLAYNPARRATASQALSMSYFTHELPKPEVPAGILTAVEGEWHEFESRRARKARG